MAGQGAKAVSGSEPPEPSTLPTALILTWTKTNSTASEMPLLLGIEQDSKISAGSEEETDRDITTNNIKY